MYLILGLWLFIGNPTQAVAANNLLDSYLSDARISASNGDLYRSYKLFSFLQTKDQKFLLENAVEDYIEVLSKLSGKKKLLATCGALIKIPYIVDRAAYQCARSIYLKGGNPRLAQQFLLKVDTERMGHLRDALMASIYLEQEKYNKCISTLNKDKLEKFKKNSIDDVFYLTKGRCYNGKKDYENAITSLQSIKSSSRYYFESLLELTWTLFKVRDVERVKSTAEAILSTYNPREELLEKKSATTHDYFQVKYILAYLDLVIFTGKEKKLFVDINNEISSYQNSSFASKNLVKEFYDEIMSAASLTDLRLNSKQYQKYMYHVLQWLPNAEQKELGQDIEFMISLNNEYKRKDQISKEFSSYFNSLSQLRAIYKNRLKQRVISQYEQANNVLNGFLLKNLIGKIDLHNLRQTKGLWSIDDAAAEFNKTMRNLSSKMGDIP